MGTSSPPPAYNFRTIPVVRNREPLWATTDNELQVTPTFESMTPDPTDVLQRESLVSSLLDAQPEAIMCIPDDTILPLLLALSLLLMFVGLLISQVAVIVIGILAVSVCVIVWLVPGKKERAAWQPAK